MSKPDPSTHVQLGQLQRWMQAVITHPDGVESGLGRETAQAEISLGSDQLEEIILPSRRLSSLRRLEIYANAYYARLLECLRDEFPATVHFLGETVFDAFAFSYLQDCPSRSYTLADLGGSFPAYFRDTRPPLDDPRTADDDQWEEFLIDLVTLERTYSEVFTGPGPEKSDVLCTEDIAAIPEDRLDDLLFVPAPSLRLMTFQYPVHDYITAVRFQGAAEVLDRMATWLIITRRDYVVRRASVTLLEYQFLSSLVAGQTLGQAIEQCLSRCLQTEEGLAALLQEWFSRWATSQYFMNVMLRD